MVDFMNKFTALIAKSEQSDCKHTSTPSPPESVSYIPVDVAASEHSAEGAL